MTELTRVQILSMKPGREFDKLVDNIVMNRYEATYEHGTWVYPAPRSRDMGAAWEVVNKLQYDYVLNFKLERKYCLAEMKFVATFENLDGKNWVADGWTAPEAICKASLLAVMEE